MMTKRRKPKALPPIPEARVRWQMVLDELRLIRADLAEVKANTAPVVVNFHGPGGR